MLPGNPYDGHTLSGIVDGTEKLTGCEIERAYVAKGLSRQRHRKSAPRLHLRPEARGLWPHQTRAASALAIEAVIGHMKMDGHLGRCYLSKAATAMLPTPFSPPSATLPPRPRLAEDRLEPNAAHSLQSVYRSTSAHEDFLTGDY